MIIMELSDLLLCFSLFDTSCGVRSATWKSICSSQYDRASRTLRAPKVEEQVGLAAKGAFKEIDAVSFKG